MTTTRSWCSSSWQISALPRTTTSRLSWSAIAEHDLAVNTGGGQLSAGQAGAGGGMLGLVEVVRQLSGGGGNRQVEGARYGLVTGYGMVTYRFGSSANAAVLESS